MRKLICKGRSSFNLFLVLVCVLIVATIVLTSCSSAPPYVSPPASPSAPAPTPTPTPTPMPTPAQEPTTPPTSPVTPALSRQPYPQPEQMKQYITPNDPWVKQAIQKILSDQAFAFNDFDALRDWVSLHISYKSDLSAHGVNEYWQLPAETLDLRTGDCEDFALLLCSLLRAYGVPTDQVYVVAGITEDGSGGHAYLAEKWYTGMWRIIETEQGALVGWALADYITETSFQPVAYFNDQSYLNALPSLPAGTYEFQITSSLASGSAAQLKRTLKAGQKVTGTLEHIQKDGPTYAWTINVYDILDQIVFTWSGSDLKHVFTFTPALDGTYRIEVVKKDLDLYVRYARLTIGPPDWIPLYH